MAYTRKMMAFLLFLADACDREGVAPELDVVDFYQDAHRCLSGAEVNALRSAALFD